MLKFFKGLISGIKKLSSGFMRQAPQAPQADQAQPVQQAPQVQPAAQGFAQAMPNNPVFSQAFTLPMQDDRNTSFDMEGNNFGRQPETMQALVSLVQHTEATSLKLGGNCIGVRPRGSQALAGTIENNSNIKDLDLSRNDIGDNPEVAQAFADAMKNPTLTSLNLSGNHIGDDARAAQNLANGIKDNTNLRSLDLSCNNIGLKPEAAQAFADAIKNNETLTSLNLEGNRIGRDPEATQAFADAIQHNLSLTSLDLSGNDMENNPEAAQAFAKAFALMHKQGMNVSVTIDERPFNTSDKSSIAGMHNSLLRDGILGEIEMDRAQATVRGMLSKAAIVPDAAIEPLVERLAQGPRGAQRAEGLSPKDFVSMRMTCKQAYEGVKKKPLSDSNQDRPMHVR